MARQPRPQQPSNDDDSPPDRPDVEDYMTSLTHSGESETFEFKESESGLDE